MSPKMRFGVLLFGILIVALATACAQPAAPTAAPTKASIVQPTPTSSGAAKPTATAPTPSPQPAAAAPTKPASTPAAAAVKPLDPPVTVKVGVVKLYFGAPPWIAKEKGYFEQEGLKVELVDFASGGAMVAPLIVGDLDVGTPSSAPGLFNAVRRAVGLRIVGSNSSYAPGHGTVVNIRKDLAGKIKDLPDLKGKNVGTPAKPGGSDIMLDKALKPFGMSGKDVNFVVLSAADQNAGFANGAIDVGFQSEPQAAQGILKGLSAPWKMAYDFYPDMEITAYAYSEKFMKEKPEAAKRFMVAILRAVRDYHESFVTNTRDRKDLTPLMNSFDGFNDASMYDVVKMPYLNPDGYINKKLMADDVQWYFENGALEGNVDVNSMVDDQFVDYAISRLGRYKK